MKRYLLFCGDRFYPDGGMKDLAKSSDDITSLFTHWDEWCDRSSSLVSLWGHIYDTQEEKIILFTEYDNGQKCKWAMFGDELEAE